MAGLKFKENIEDSSTQTLNLPHRKFYLKYYSEKLINQNWNFHFHYLKNPFASNLRFITQSLVNQGMQIKTVLKF